MKTICPLTKLIYFCVATGCMALVPALFAVSPPPDGGYPGENTAEGQDALFSLESGSQNTAVGFEALYSSDKSSANTACGASSLHSNAAGSFNTSIGADSLYSNTSGSSNTAVGFQTLYLNSGGGNTATGIFAMYNNTSGGSNCAFGVRALNNNTTASNNTAIGIVALGNNTTGKNNIALGYFAGSHIQTGSYNIEIGNRGLATDSHTIRIGSQETHVATYIGGISGATVADGVGVVIDTNGHLGTITSSARYKEAVKPMDQASEAILSLKPVSFRYKKELDPRGIAQFGLVAEDVEKVDPDLVAHDKEGKPYTVRYEAVNAMLLNEFLKEHRKMKEQSSQIAKQDCKVQKLEATVVQLQLVLKAQAAQIQKVSDQLKTLAPVPRVVAND
jgi:hypothetical protein